MTSKDGQNWSDPFVVFPEYTLPEVHVEYENRDVVIPAGMHSIMHQRMGFYVAPNGRLLTSGYYSYCYTLKKSPNTGKGVGRVVREIYKDGSLGPIYFIRYNRRGGKGFIKLIESRKMERLWGFANMLEDRGWKTPTSATDSKYPYGVPYYLNMLDSGASAGFNGKTITYQDVSTGTTCAGIDASIEAKWRNYAATYATVDTALLKTLSVMADQWNYDGSDSMVDYFHVNYYSGSHMDSDQAHEEWQKMFAEIQADHKGLRLYDPT